MITPFNRKELILTTSAEKQSNIKQILDNNHIPYTYKTFYRGMDQRGKILSVNLDNMIEYKIFVYKKDYDKAIYLINHQHESLC